MGVGGGWKEAGPGATEEEKVGGGLSEGVKRRGVPRADWREKEGVVGRGEA